MPEHFPQLGGFLESPQEVASEVRHRLKRVATPREFRALLMRSRLRSYVQPLFRVKRLPQNLREVIRQVWFAKQTSAVQAIAAADTCIPDSAQRQRFVAGMRRLALCQSADAFGTRGSFAINMPYRVCEKFQCPYCHGRRVGKLFTGFCHRLSGQHVLVFGRFRQTVTVTGEPPQTCYEDLGLTAYADVPFSSARWGGLIARGDVTPAVALTSRLASHFSERKAIHRNSGAAYSAWLTLASPVGPAAFEVVTSGVLVLRRPTDFVRSMSHESFRTAGGRCLMVPWLDCGWSRLSALLANTFRYPTGLIGRYSEQLVEIGSAAAGRRLFVTYGALPVLKRRPKQ